MKLLATAIMFMASSAFALDSFQLPNIDNESVEVAPKENGLTVVCFLGTECPLAKLYAPRLNDLAAQFESCLLYTSPSPRDKRQSRMPSSA